jgi:hypothetical protein
VAATFAEPVADGAEHSAQKDCERGFKRQIHTDRDQHRTAHLHHDHCQTEEDANHHQRPGHVSADDALREIEAPGSARYVGESERDEDAGLLGDAQRLVDRATRTAPSALTLRMRVFC